MKHKLHLACGDEMLRPVLSYIKVTKQICITTNAHILAIVNTENVFGEQFTEELKDDAEIYIHSKHYAQLTKFSNRLALNDGSITGYNKKGETFICPFKTKEQLEGTYPDFERVIPNFDELGKDYCSLNAVSINPKLLLNLQSALGTDLPLTLYFSGGSHRPIIALEPNGDSLGLIMPCQITNELSDYTGYKPNKQQTK